jgi:hypothetical protein
MKHLTKIILTTVVWLVCGGIAIASGVDGISAGSVIITMTALASALGGTGILWNEEEDEKEQASGSSKKKRTTSGENPQLDTLLALMTEDERDTFKEQLKQRLLEGTARLSDDGEISLGELLVSSDEDKKLRDTH